MSTFCQMSKAQTFCRSRLLGRALPSLPGKRQGNGANHPVKHHRWASTGSKIGASSTAKVGSCVAQIAQSAPGLICPASGSLLWRIPRMSTTQRYAWHEQCPLQALSWCVNTSGSVSSLAPLLSRSLLIGPVILPPPPCFYPSRETISPERPGRKYSA